MNLKIINGWKIFECNFSTAEGSVEVVQCQDSLVL